MPFAHKDEAGEGARKCTRKEARKGIKKAFNNISGEV